MVSKAAERSRRQILIPITAIALLYIHDNLVDAIQQRVEKGSFSGMVFTVNRLMRIEKIYKMRGEPLIET